LAEVLAANFDHGLAVDDLDPHQQVVRHGPQGVNVGSRVDRVRPEMDSGAMYCGVPMTALWPVGLTSRSTSNSLTKVTNFTVLETGAYPLPGPAHDHELVDRRFGRGQRARL
jgi:hypothetical protein